MEQIPIIKKVSSETRNAMIRKSAQTLPMNPSERGYSGEEIRRRFYQPILDAANSTLSELDRVVDETNKALSQSEENFNEFINNSLIAEPYRVLLDSSVWEYDQDKKRYMVTVPVSEHNIEDYKEIGVDMMLLDSTGKYISVNQYEVDVNGNVILFHETNGAGFANIYIKREGYILSDLVVHVSHVAGLAPVAMSNNYKDLDNIPDTDQIVANEIMISKIISGAQKVNSSINSENAEKAVYAEESENAATSKSSQYATRAAQDENGVNIAGGYCKQNGTYDNLTAGNAKKSSRATADEDGQNIKNSYAKQNGTYADMSVGHSSKADNATNATNADKATKDANGANIPNTYAKQSGSYPNLTAGNATSAGKATNDVDGNPIKTTYAKQNGSYPNLTAGNADVAGSIKFVTTAPTAAPPAGTLIIYYGTTAPTTRYDRVLYLIGY